MKVHESFPFSISLSWKGSGPDAQENGPDNQLNTVVFPKGNPISSMKALTFYRSGTFSVDFHYNDVSELQTSAKISTYTVSQFTSFSCSIILFILGSPLTIYGMQIGPFQTPKGEKAKVKVKARLNLHGIVSVESATVSLFTPSNCSCNWLFSPLPCHIFMVSM